MRATSERQTKVVLELNESETRTLMSLLQNPMIPVEVAMQYKDVKDYEEPEDVKDLREELFELLRQQLRR